MQPHAPCTCGAPRRGAARACRQEPCMPTAACAPAPPAPFPCGRPPCVDLQPKRLDCRHQPDRAGARRQRGAQRLPGRHRHQLLCRGLPPRRALLRGAARGRAQLQRHLLLPLLYSSEGAVSCLIDCLLVRPRALPPPPPLLAGAAVGAQAGRRSATAPFKLPLPPRLPASPQLPHGQWHQPLRPHRRQGADQRDADLQRALSGLSTGGSAQSPPHMNLAKACSLPSVALLVS